MQASVALAQERAHDVRRHGATSARRSRARSRPRSARCLPAATASPMRTTAPAWRPRDHDLALDSDACRRPDGACARGASVERIAGEVARTARSRRDPHHRREASGIAHAGTSRNARRGTCRSRRRGRARHRPRRGGSASAGRSHSQWPGRRGERRGAGAGRHERGAHLVADLVRSGTDRRADPRDQAGRCDAHRRNRVLEHARLQRQPCARRRPRCRRRRRTARAGSRPRMASTLPRTRVTAASATGSSDAGAAASVTTAVPCTCRSQRGDAGSAAMRAQRFAVGGDRRRIVATARAEVEAIERRAARRRRCHAWSCTRARRGRGPVRQQQTVRHPRQAHVVPRIRPQRGQQALHVVGQRRLEGDRLAGLRMLELEFFRVQRLALECAQRFGEFCRRPWAAGHHCGSPTSGCSHVRHVHTIWCVRPVSRRHSTSVMVCLGATCGSA